jgi:hypothetical protein
LASGRWLQAVGRVWEGEVSLGHYQTCKCKLKALLSPTAINAHVIKSQENRFIECDTCFACTLVPFLVGWVRKEGHTIS